MIMYHVSDNIYNITKEFIPRIPNTESYSVLENNEIPRVCVSPSIDQCITAVPYWGGSNFVENMASPLNNICKIVRVYEFNINLDKELNRGNIIQPYILKQNDWVYDALITEEHWILKPIKPSRTYLINILNYEENLEDIYSADICTRLSSGENTDDIDFDDELETTITTLSVKYEVVSNELIFVPFERDFTIMHDFIDKVDSLLYELEDGNVYIQNYYLHDNVLTVFVSAPYMTYTYKGLNKILDYVLSSYIIKY